MDYKGKHVLVVGAGVSGLAAARILQHFGATVELSDAKPESLIQDGIKALADEGVELTFGKQDPKELDGKDLVVVSPAVPLRVPLLQEALKRGIPVIGEVELAYRLAQSPLFAITGTNGKTTTTTLVGLLLQEKYGAEKTGVGGNIGEPLSEVALRIGKEGVLVAEISSYQMETADTFHPHVAAVLNVTPDHLQRHGTMEVYQNMKERIFAKQTAKDFLVLNYDDPRTRGMEDRAKSKIYFFSRKRILREGAWLENGALMLRLQGQQTERLLLASELRMPGLHNIENALAAAIMAALAGVDIEAIRKVLRAFKGVEHRIEHVLDINGVPWYNDSKATNVDSAVKALQSFTQPLVLILGGDDKMTDLTDFMLLVKKKAKAVIFIGDAALRFYKAAEQAGIKKERLHEAAYSMKTAADIAYRLATKGDVVLLSPACASFDMFDNYEERGRVFKKIARAIGEAAQN